MIDQAGHIHQLNLRYSEEATDSFLICYVRMGTGKNSTVLINSIMAAIGFANQNNGKREEPAPQQPSKSSVESTVFGTLQLDGHLYLEVNAVMIGNNLNRHEHKKYGF
jgi:hypothetical protein